MKSFRSTIFTSFFMAGLPASVALFLHFGGAIDIPTKGAFVTIPLLVGTVVFNYLSTTAFLLKDAFFSRQAEQPNDAVSGA